MTDNGFASRAHPRFRLPTLFAFVAVLAIWLAVLRFDARLATGIALFGVGLGCAIWKARRYRQRGLQELRIEIAHLLFGPSVLLALLLMVVGLGLVVSRLLEYTR